MHNNFDRRGGATSEQEANVIALWQKFDSQFPGEEDCLEVLYTRYNDQPIKCSYCQSEVVNREYGARTGKCSHCKKTTWFTAGTFFHRIRKAKPWLAAIWLIERGVGLSAGLLHRLADIATSTAWLILKKIHLVINSNMETESEAILEPSASFLAAICKRSSETPAQSHPVSEQKATEKREGTKVCAPTRHVLDLAASIKFIREHFHGSSRKYLQFFLAAYWCKIDREKWTEWSLLKACRGFRTVCLEEIHAFNSPLLLKLICRPIQHRANK